MFYRILSKIKEWVETDQNYVVNAHGDPDKTKKEEEKAKEGEEAGREKSFKFLDTLDKSFKTRFGKLGFTIGKHPWWFLLTPMLICVMLAMGLWNFRYENDPIDLFGPLHGQGIMEKNIIEKYFPSNYSSRFTLSRFIKPKGLVRVLITAQDGGTILRSNMWREIKFIGDLIKKKTVTKDGQSWTYQDLCAKWEENCFQNDVLHLTDIMDEVEAGNQSLSYPFMLNPETFQPYIFPLAFGGVEVRNNGTEIKSVKGVQLVYMTYGDDAEQEARNYEWEQAVFKTVDEARDLNYIRVDRFSANGVGDEVDNGIFLGFFIFVLGLPLLVIFTMITMSSRDWVRAKPWLGLLGLVATLFGVLGGYGVVCLMGTPLISLVLASMVIALGIGVDDGFVMLAAWRKTNVMDSVPQRMQDAYREAAMSITITSLTDIFSFWVGVATPFKAVQIFCLYTSAAVIGTYLCHVTTFGGALAISGYLEADNRHGLFFWKKIPAKSTLDLHSNKSWFHRHFWMGGQNPDDPLNPLDQKEFSFMIFFRDHWAACINTPWVKALVFLLFFIYIGVAGWGISLTQEGMSLNLLAIQGSRAEQYFQTDEKYFREYPYRIQVVVTGDLDYSNSSVRALIENTMQQLEQSKFVGPNGALLSESWLRNFERYAQRLESIDLALDLSDERSFIQSLRDNYLPHSSPFSEDVRFNEDNSKIVASRFLIQTTNIHESSQETEMVQNLRAIASSQAPRLNVTLYNLYFSLFDISLEIRRTTIQCVTVTCVIMLVISLLLIPNPICSLWVAFSIMSIETGVLGFLMLWDVTLDGVTMLNLVVCIGFSVDFSAHISYAYINSSGTPEERVRESLFALGMPIVQGALSTVSCIILMFFAPSYFLTTFAKSILLVMIIASAHGLMLLPVLLSIFGPGERSKGGEKGEKEVEEKYTKKIELGS